MTTKNKNKKLNINTSMATSEKGSKPALRLILSSPPAYSQHPPSSAIKSEVGDNEKLLKKSTQPRPGANLVSFLDALANSIDQEVEMTSKL